MCSDSFLTFMISIKTFYLATQHLFLATVRPHDPYHSYIIQQQHDESSFVHHIFDEGDCSVSPEANKFKYITGCGVLISCTAISALLHTSTAKLQRGTKISPASMDFTKDAASTEFMDSTWCSSAIQVFQPMTNRNSVVLLDSNKVTNLPNMSLNVEEDEPKAMPQWKLDDVKSWIWLQKAIHPELEYDLCFSKKWLTRKINPWKVLSIKKWVKEMKQKKKEKQRLQKAEVHAAISLAGVATALAAITAENAEPSKSNALKDRAVASAAALVAAQCAQAAEVVGAKPNQLHSAITAAMTATDASDIITLIAAAATSLRGAAMLRGRAGNKERLKGSAQAFLYDEFDFAKCRELLAKGDELLVGHPEGTYRQRWVSIVQNNDGKVLLKVKKNNVFMAFSRTTESTVCRMETNPYEEHIEKRSNSCFLKLITNNGKIELLFEDPSQYKKWIVSINHMLIISTTL